MDDSAKSALYVNAISLISNVHTFCNHIEMFLDDDAECDVHHIAILKAMTDQIMPQIEQINDTLTMESERKAN